MFTSGTTARPKGVLHSHNTLDYENRSIIEVYGLSEADVVFMASPVTHVTGHAVRAPAAAMLGTTACAARHLGPRRGARPDGPSTGARSPSRPRRSCTA